MGKTLNTLIAEEWGKYCAGASDLNPRVAKNISDDFSLLSREIRALFSFVEDKELRDILRIGLTLECPDDAGVKEYSATEPGLTRAAKDAEIPPGEWEAAVRAKIRLQFPGIVSNAYKFVRIRDARDV